MKKILLIAVLAVAILVVGCVQQQNGTGGSQNASNQTGNITVMTIEAFAYGYNPSTITLVQGETVRLTIINKDITHTFTIDELGINIPLPAGQTVVQDITPSVSGTFQLYCAVPGHRAAGMVGTAAVTE